MPSDDTRARAREGRRDVLVINRCALGFITGGHREDLLADFVIDQIVWQILVLRRHDDVARGDGWLALECRHQTDSHSTHNIHTYIHKNADVKELVNGLARTLNDLSQVLPDPIAIDNRCVVRASRFGMVQNLARVCKIPGPGVGARTASGKSVPRANQAKPNWLGGVFQLRQ